MGSTRTLRVALFALLYGALAFYSLGLREASGHSTLLWPAGGILLGALMVSQRKEWPWWLAVAALLHFLAGVVHDRSMAVSLVYVLSDVLIMPVMAAVWRSRIRTPAKVLDVPENLGWFLIVLLAGGLAGALISTLGLTAAGIDVPAAGWQTWLVSEVIGNLIGAPLVVAWSSFRARRSGGLTQRNFLVGMLWFLFMIATAMIAFDGPTGVAVLGKSSYELAYLPLLFVILIALAWDQRGLTLALLILGMIAALNTMQGEGPFAQMNAFFDHALLEVQGYIGAAALAGLLMAAISSTRHRALREASAWKTRFEASLIGNGVLLYEYDPATRAMLWAGELPALFGSPPPPLDNLDMFLDQVHPEDKQRVTQCFADRADASHNDSATEPVQYRIRTVDGNWLTITDIGAPIAALNDEVHGVNGFLRAQEAAALSTNRV